MEVHYYNQKIKDFINSLDLESQEQAIKSLELLEEYGHLIELPHSKSLGEKLFELRCIGSGVRFLYIFHNRNAIVLNIFIKKTNKIPKKDLDLARKRQREF